MQLTVMFCFNHCLLALCPCKVPRVRVACPVPPIHFFFFSFVLHMHFVMHSPAPWFVLHMSARPSVCSETRHTTPSASRCRHTLTETPSSFPFHHPFCCWGFPFYGGGASLPSPPNARSRPAPSVLFLVLISSVLFLVLRSLPVYAYCLPYQMQSGHWRL